MASFDERATALPDPDIRGLNSGSSVSGTPGLIQSGISAGSDLLDFAVRADTKNTLSEFQSDQSDILRDHEQDVLLKAAQNQKKSGELDDVIYGQDPKDEAAVRDTISQLEALRSARNIPPMEARMRSEALLRERISQNPHLAQQFRQINAQFAGSRQALNSALGAEDSILQNAFAESVTADFKAATAMGATMDEFREFKSNEAKRTARLTAAAEAFDRNAENYYEYEQSFISSASKDLTGFLLTSITQAETQGTALSEGDIRAVLLQGANNFRSEFLNSLKESSLPPSMLGDRMKEFDAKFASQMSALEEIMSSSVQDHKAFLKEMQTSDWLDRGTVGLPELRETAKFLISQPGTDFKDLTNATTGLSSMIRNAPSGEALLRNIQDVLSGSLDPMGGTSAWALQGIAADPGVMKQILTATSIGLFKTPPGNLTAEQVSSMGPIFDTAMTAAWSATALMPSGGARTAIENQATGLMLGAAGLRKGAEATEALYEALETGRVATVIRKNPELQQQAKALFASEDALAREAIQDARDLGMSISIREFRDNREKVQASRGDTFSRQISISAPEREAVGTGRRGRDILAPEVDTSEVEARLRVTLRKLRAWAKIRPVYDPEFRTKEYLQDLLSEPESEPEATGTPAEE